MKRLIILLSLMSVPVYADFNGKLTGKGALTSSIGMSLICPDIHFTLTQDAKSFSMVGATKCADGFEINYEPTSMSIVKNRLILENKDIGSVTSKEVRIKFQEPDEQGQMVDYTILFIQKGSAVQFEQGIKAPSYSISIKGELK